MQHGRMRIGAVEPAFWARHGCCNQLVSMIAYTPSGATRPFRILVAEDDAEMRRLVTDALREDGYEVVELADGGRLLVDIAARLKAAPEGDYEDIDLIVSDIRMPICTGLQILEALRQAHWRTPVILMTAFGDKATRRQAESLRAVLFDKPFDLDDLRTAVANLLPSDGSTSH
jgi:CheY-like chemotaxis protein